MACDIYVTGYSWCIVSYHVIYHFHIYEHTWYPRLGILFLIVIFIILINHTRYLVSYITRYNIQISLCRYRRLARTVHHTARRHHTFWWDRSRCRSTCPRDPTPPTAAWARSSLPRTGPRTSLALLPWQPPEGLARPRLPTGCDRERNKRIYHHVGHITWST